MVELSLEFEKFMKGGAIMLSVPIEEYEKIFLNLVDYLVNKKNLNGIILTVNKSCNNITELLKSRGINISNITIIDCISSSSDKQEGSCIYLSRPFNVNETYFVIDKLFKNKDIKFLIFDTMTSIYMYNSKTITKFFQFALAQYSKDKLIILLKIGTELESVEERIIAQSCNKLIKI